MALKREKKQLVITSGRQFGLRPKLIIGIILIIMLVTTLTVIIGVQLNLKNTRKHYDDLGYKVAHTVESVLDKDALKKYAETAMGFSKGEKTEDEVKAITEDPQYIAFKEQLGNIRLNMDANDIYIAMINMDVYSNYDEKAFEAGEWKPMVYIFDSYYKTDEEYPLGSTSKMNPTYREVISKSYETGVRTDTLLLSEWEGDPTMTAFYPVKDGGVVIAAIGVEIPMRTVNADINAYIRSVIIAAVIAMAVLLAVGVYTSIKTIINPISIVSEEAKRFVENNTEVSDKLADIHTRDEIEDLSMSLLKLEIDTREYIQNITRITAEKERIGAELDVATQIQADMLPTIFPPFPNRSEIELFASMTPAKQVGGDFYDFFLVDDSHLGLVIADVSGKGVPAALFMVIAKTLIKNATQQGSLTPAQILSQVNEQLCEGNRAELFVTVWLAIIDLDTGKGIAANAGHEHPALRKSGGKFELIKYKHSPAVATMEGMRFREHEFEMGPGDTLFVYTDGVPEATNEDNVLFGEERMIEALNSTPDASPEQVLTNVHEAVNEFVDEAPQFDDLTMLCFRYKGKKDSK